VKEHAVLARRQASGIDIDAAAVVLGYTHELSYRELAAPHAAG
jgi:hypothetical protein